MPRKSREAFTSIARYLDSELQISDHTRECVERLESGEDRVSLNHSLKVSCRLGCGSGKAEVVLRHPTFLGGGLCQPASKCLQVTIRKRV
jgi:hypothetical protein